jgi:hypothetical protein
VDNLALSADGQLIATGSGYLNFSGQLQLWDTELGSLRHAFPFNSYSASFSPQGPVLLTINTNLALCKWPPKTLLEKSGVGSPAVRHQVKFNNAGTRFLTAGINLTCYQTPLLITHSDLAGSDLMLRWISPDVKTSLESSDLVGAWTEVARDLATTSYTIPIAGGGNYFRLSQPF